MQDIYWKLLTLLAENEYSIDTLSKLLNLSIVEILNLIDYINTNYSTDDLIIKKNNLISLNPKKHIFTKNNLPNLMGLNIELSNKLDSTNNYLYRKIKSKEILDIHKKVIVTNEQTAGKGRRGNSWITSIGDSLTFSIAYICKKSFNDFGPIVLITSYSCAKVLRSYNIPVQIKWPNDLVIDSKKLGGILVESINTHNNKRVLIIGIGINYNFPLIIKDDAIGINTYKKDHYNLNNIFSTLVKTIFEDLDNFFIDGFNIKGEYISLLRDFNKKVHIIQGSKLLLTGKVVDVSNTGSVIIEDKNHKLHKIMNGNISLRN